MAPREASAACATVHWTDAQLRQQLATLAHEVQRLEDQNAIEKLQRIYGYYLDKGLWSQAADLFAEDGEVEIAGTRRLRGQGACAGVSARDRPGGAGRRAPVTTTCSCNPSCM